MLPNKPWTHQKLTQMLYHAFIGSPEDNAVEIGWVTSEDIIRLEDKLYKLQTLGEKVYLVEPNKYIEHLVSELTV